MADRFGYGEIGLDINPCRGCEDYDAPDGCKSNGGCGKPQTNADRIRAMTDEELASFLYHSWNNALWCNGGCDGECSCEPCWLNWLKQEVDDAKV